jgi:16S rRNA (cytidine1402-2'-O)-methyltransferase
MTERARGILVLVGTPLGNRADLSPRAREAILGADLLFCEDTRSPVRLLGADVGLPPRLSCFLGNEHERVAALRAALEAGKRVALVTEAGLPVVSDPGLLLVQAALADGHTVDVVPGPTAVTTALVASGFAGRGFRFLGFVPRRGTDRADALGAVAGAAEPCVLYEAGNRVLALLRDLAPRLGERRVLVARELTKVHQELARGTAGELAARWSEPLRGEVTLVVEGGAEAPPFHMAAVECGRRVLELMLDPGLRPRARARALAALLDLPAAQVYARLSGVRDDPGD